MLYLTDFFDYSLLQFCPAEVTSTEISYWKLKEIISSQQTLKWFRNECSWDSLLNLEKKEKIDLQKLRQLEGENPVFKGIRVALENKARDLRTDLTFISDPDLAVYQPNDEVVLLVLVPDCHLVTGENGFRYFHIKIKKLESKTLDSLRSLGFGIQTE